tara:strand:+ start:4078 stop:4428 length:351 start_codon:yes stop_codon:yes gene_type:complete
MKSKLQKLKKAIQERKLFPGEKYYGLDNKLPLKDKGEGGVSVGGNEICSGVWKVVSQPVEQQTPGVVFKHPLGSCIQGPRIGTMNNPNKGNKYPLKRKTKSTYNKIKSLAKKKIRT